MKNLPSNYNAKNFKSRFSGQERIKIVMDIPILLTKSCSFFWANVTLLAYSDSFRKIHN